MKRIALHFVMLLALLSGAVSADASLASGNCQMASGFMTDVIHITEASKCSDDHQLCEQICVSEVRVIQAHFTTAYWNVEIVSVPLEIRSESIRLGFPSTIYHPPWV
ncbi:hypothetical protein [Amphritea sp.]|uniref:hypothetical protein n=1 Tax=Amphritea sp. TaxID=1872502 RepID=UPI0025C4474B|nr:hypothetical protein [Amphritea sp.]